MQERRSIPDAKRIMSMDGQYFAKEPRMAVRYVHGWTVFRKEPRMAVRYVHGWTVFPSLVVVFRKEPWTVMRFA